MKKIITIVLTIGLFLFFVVGCGLHKEEELIPDRSVHSVQQESQSFAAVMQRLRHTEHFAPGALEHIFSGEINKRNDVVGYHSESVKGAKAHAENPGPPDKHGVYRAEVFIKNHRKEANHGNSTFYPRKWTAQEVVDAINVAYDNKKKRTESQYEGRTTNGIRIVFYLNRENKIMTAYPMYDGK